MSHKISKKLKVFFLFGVLYAVVFGFGVNIENRVTTVLAVPDPEPNDITSFFDAEAANITYAIAPAGSVNAKLDPNAKLDLTSAQIYHEDRVLVRSATIDYNAFDMDLSNEIPMLHNLRPDVMKAVYDIGRITGEYRLNHIQGMVTDFNYFQHDLLLGPNLKIYSTLSAEKQSKLNNLLSFVSLQTTDNNTEATGYSVTGSDKFALSDLKAPTGANFELNNSDANITTFSNTLDPHYLGYAKFLSGNTTDTDFISPSDLYKEKDRDLVITGFNDLEEDGFLTTLRANFAINHTTASDVVTPDRVTILSYTGVGANLTNYITQNFADRIRGAIDESVSSSTTATYINVWGFKIFISQKITPVNALALPDISQVVGQVFNAATAFVSTPLSAIKTKIIDPLLNAGGNAINTVTNLGNDALKGLLDLPNTISSTLNMGKEMIQSALTKGLDSVGGLVKGGQEFLASAKNTLAGLGENIIGGAKGILDEIKQFSQNSFNTIASMPQKFFENITNVLLIGGLAIGGIILAVAGYSYLKAPKQENGGNYNNYRGYNGNNDRNKYRPI